MGRREVNAAGATYRVEVSVDTSGGDARGQLLAPSGLSTPDAACLGCEVAGGQTTVMTEPGTGQRVLLVTPKDDRVTFRYHYAPGGTAYPDQIFQPLASRYTRAADELVAEAQAIAPLATPLDRARAIACDVAQKFTYGHPKDRFNDGFDVVPALGCGLTEGSCVDINTYFMAVLRAAGIEAGYLTGYFFPLEKGGWCEDAHCWVVTRIDGRIQAWDIAHHLKMGTRDIHPALNPKPGFRAAVAHSMGLDFPQVGMTGVKLISQPMWVTDGDWARADLTIVLNYGAREPGEQA